MLDRLLPSNARLRSAVVVAIVLAAAALYTQVILPGPKGGSGRGTPLAIIFEFLVLGSLTGLVACTIVLVYRVQLFINFGAAALGVAGAVFGAFLIRLTPCPFIVAVPAGIIVGALLGVTFEIIFVRRFFNAPRLTLTVMSVLAVGALTGATISQIISLPFFPRLRNIDPETLNGPITPKLPFPGFHFAVGGLQLRFGFGAVFAIWTAVFCLLGLGYFFRYTRSGTAVRALAENADRAELLGISTRRLSTLVWAIVGAISAATTLAALFLDIGGASSAQGANTDILLVPLVAAVIARMRSFGAAAFAAIVITVITGAIGFSYPGSDSLVTGAEFLALSAGLLLQRRSLLRSEAQTEGGWAASDEVRGVPKELARIPTVRAIRLSLIGGSILVAALFPFLFSTRVSSLAATSLLFGIVALSLVVLTGWAGQISLGQLGFMAVGALVGGSLISHGGIPFWLAVPLTTAITGAVALIVGLPALRIKGLFLAAVTFAFAVAADQLLFDDRYFGWLQPGAIARPRLFFLDFADQRSMYYLTLLAVIIAGAVVVNLRRSRFGRILIAMRENEPALQSTGVSVIRTKLTAFAVSGALAGFAGVLYGVQQRGVAAGDFSSLRSLNLFAFTILGGVTSVVGALFGQVVQFALERGATNNQIVGYFQAYLPLAVLYVVPGGAISLLVSLRDGVLRIIAQRRQIVVPSLFADYDTEALERRLIPLAPLSDDERTRRSAGVRYWRPSQLYRGSGVLLRGGRRREEESSAIGAAARSAGDHESTIDDPIPETVGSAVGSPR